MQISPAPWDQRPGRKTPVWVMVGLTALILMGLAMGWGVFQFLFGRVPFKRESWDQRRTQPYTTIIRMAEGVRDSGLLMGADAEGVRSKLGSPDVRHPLRKGDDSMYSGHAPQDATMAWWYDLPPNWLDPNGLIVYFNAAGRVVSCWVYLG